MRKASADMLLLNCTNLPWRPIFPYAFVQVSEVARRYGLTVRRQDLLYVEHWEEKIASLIKSTNPACVGLHIRQIDTLDVNDYLSIAESKPDHYRTFYPLQNAKTIISIIRKYTNAPVVLGGFGFTAHSINIANELEIDLGVRGCPDGFFAHFNDVVSGRKLHNVPGLIHHNGTFAANPMMNADPADELEYNDTIISELKQFYGPMLFGHNPPTIAIEVARGCPFSCYFCTEPDVKGNKVRWRNFTTVATEMEQLVRYGFRNFWFICSELNIGGTQFVMELAGLVCKIREKMRVPIFWSGYSLPTLKKEEIEYLKAAGYVGAMNDLLSLDSANLRRSRVPYKKEQALEFLVHMSRDAISGNESSELDKYTANAPSKFSDVISMFLGNAFADRSTIGNTLDEIDKHQLSARYNQGHIISSTRVFPLGRTDHLINSKTTLSFSSDGITNTDTNFPTFHFPEFMVEELRSPEKVIAFLRFIAETYMSKAYLKSLCITRFVVETIDLYQDRNLQVQSRLEILMNEIYGIRPDEGNPLFTKRKQKNEEDEINVSTLSMVSYWPYKTYERALINADNASMSIKVNQLFTTNYELIKRIQTEIASEWFDGIEFRGSAYALAKLVFQRYGSIHKFRSTLLACEPHNGEPIAVIYIEYLLFVTRVKKGSEYRSLISTFSNVGQLQSEPA